jgi:hypothetical protein
MSTELNSKIVRTIPKRAYDDIGDAIGVLHNGVMVFDTEDVAGVLMDCCIHDWFEDGRNLVERYAETHPAEQETDDAFLLSAYTQAQYRLLAAEF